MFTLFITFLKHRVLNFNLIRIIVKSVYAVSYGTMALDPAILSWLLQARGDPLLLGNWRVLIIIKY